MLEAIVLKRPARNIPYRFIWVMAFLVMAGPLTGLMWLAATGSLGANPIEFVNRYLGDWALRILLVALTASPLNIMFGWTWPMRLRRMLGLWAFVYAALHIANYVILDQFFDWRAIGADIAKRGYITVGMAAFVILSALAATSWRGAIKYLGAKTWRRLHKLVYLAAGLGGLHYFWMVKADIRLPLILIAILAVLLAVRAGAFLKRN